LSPNGGTRQKQQKAIIGLIRRQAAQAESLGDRATRYLYETILLKTEERAFHLDHFLPMTAHTLGSSWRLIMGQPINKTTLV